MSALAHSSHLIIISLIISKEFTCGGMDGTLVPLCSGLCRFSPFHSLSVSSESSNCDFHCEARVNPPPPFVTCCSADTLSSSICANCVIEQSRIAERPPLTCCRLSALLLGSLLRGSLCSVTCKTEMRQDVRFDKPSRSVQACRLTDSGYIE